MRDFAVASTDRLKHFEQVMKVICMLILYSISKWWV